ncbi:hypothetical protein NC651_035184 [Populus alba x Populus x berolinensis]|nr:hypothetical protein NC651_035184 [Populus alba x Populus x berolinensis]
MRIRNRKVPLPLSSLSPIPLSDPQFSRSPVVQLQLHNSPHQSLLQEPQKDEYFDPHLPSDRLNQPIGGGSKEGHGIKGEELREKSNDTRVGRWGEGEKAFSLKKRRGSFERRSNEETIMDRNKKMKTKMKTKMNQKCVQQNGDNEKDEKETKKGAGSNIKAKPRGGVLLEGSRCSRVNGRGWSIIPKKDASEEVSSHSLSSQKKEETKRAYLDDKVSVAYDEDDKEKPLVMSKRKMKLGVVKARSMSSLLG